MTGRWYPEMQMDMGDLRLERLGAMVRGGHMKVFPILIVLVLTLGAGPAEAATKFVFKNAPCTGAAGNPCDGSDWNHAWKELSDIDWGSVGASDTVKISGGTVGISYTTQLNPGRAGDPSSRLKIERATESGHNGKVTLRSVRITQPYISIDGVDKEFFEFNSAGSTYLYLNIPATYNDDYFRLQNAKIINYPDSGCWARSIDVVSGSLDIQRSEIYRSQCSEDIIRFHSNGSIKIEHSYIHGWESLYVPGMSRGVLAPCPASPISDPLCWSHSDLVEGGGTGHTMTDVTFRYNLVDDYVPTSNARSGKNHMFMTGYSTFRHIDFSYNVFKDVAQIIQARSSGTPYQSSHSVNNTFYRASSGRFSAFINNIFASDAGFYAGAGISNSVWAPGTGSFVSGSNNIQADPLFLDPENIVGADTIPFTADDGFTLSSGSPAINRGALTGQNSDIRGVPVVGNPDIGAYEFATSNNAAPSAPSNLRLSGG